MSNETGIVEINGEKITIGGNKNIREAISVLAKFGKITFSKQIRFKSTEYTVCFFKPIDEMRNMYSLGNELLVVCCNDGMNDFKSRTKDFIDYMLVTNTEFKNRLDKVTCFLIDGDSEIVKKVKMDRSENPDVRLIVPFCFAEFTSNFDNNFLSNRMREFLYEKDLFGIAVPLKNDTLFFGKDRTNIISELYARYMQGEEGGLFGLRRIGKTSILNLLKLRVEETGGVAIYYDCSSSHHYRWFEFLQYIVNTIVKTYSLNSVQNGTISFEKFSHIPNNLGERYIEKNAATSFMEDIGNIYEELNEKRILLIFDEIESIGYKTSPSDWWKKQNDALYFWQAIRAVIQTHSNYMSFVIAGVNPMCVEIQDINGTDNPIFGMVSPIYTSLFSYEDVQNMVSGIGGRLGMSFEPAIYAHMMEDYGGHPFLVRQVCSKINGELNSNKIERPTNITTNSYNLKRDEYRHGMTSVIEQILGVIEKYYPGEFEMLKKLALDGRNAFKKELALGEMGIQHLMGYNIVGKESGEYFIRIKSIEDYIKTKFIYDTTLNEQRDKRARINIRRDDIENKLRQIISYSLKRKYGKKAKERLITIIDKSSPDQTQRSKMVNASSVNAAMEELYFSQLPFLIENDWKEYANIFPDKSKFEAYMDILTRSRNVGTHNRTVTQEDEVMYSVAFEYFEDLLGEF